MDGRTALADAFSGWVELMGYNQAQIAAMGGPSTTTQTKIIRTRENVSRVTLRQIDAAIGWGPGTAQRVLHGQLDALAALRLTPVMQDDRERRQLSAFSDDELLAELGRRLARTAEDEREAHGVQPRKKSSDAGEVIELRPDYGSMAADDSPREDDLDED